MIAQCIIYKCISIIFHISSLDFTTALNLLTVEATQAGISSSDKDFYDGPGQPSTVRMTGFYLEKRIHPRAAEESLQKAKAPSVIFLAEVTSDGKKAPIIFARRA
ncbi:Hypothetical protein FKW44_020849 [Caligus rogercresseyi]|uniref:Uncharacterized protein n=1 Tax=Caligus rogercresseyi TaxID=217165 RepID=A0A7T8JUQ5_CALRO|nr:Hypothetical protein FKW44_020849 [Caligus rogercresseyi]